ncbi:glycerophosphoryl diester phosphodiesterase [Sphingobacterium alkalisoli]|uniref:Glycerophosphoryl diester phosphodiesterase n=1 Tax=Sphingobacterium alkalisoli TaxID=1874115 RepID=A0A4U0GY09_9SPHI|nr:glycerophosphoryl diester phosphodiesterase [Sphingobacterium alkalisoli]
MPKMVFMLCGLMHVMSAFGQKASEVMLKNDKLHLTWSEQSSGGYRLVSLTVEDGSPQKISVPLAEHQRTILFAAEKPSNEPIVIQDQKGANITFPDTQYRYVAPIWKQATSPVSMNIAGQVYTYQPDIGDRQPSVVEFRQEDQYFNMSETWSLDKDHPNDICVTMTIEAKLAGYYAMASPSLAVADPKDFQWAVIPGMFQGNQINPDFVRSYAYGHGIPNRPVVVRERTTSTLASLLTLASGVTIATIAEPGSARDPWPNDKKKHADWQLGLSMMNRQGELTPTLYHPVLGEENSYMKAGDKLSFSFRYTIQKADWYTVLNHTINDIYRFKDFLKLKQTERSLSDRVYVMYDYLLNDSTSKWNTQVYEGTHIGAQDYLGGVYGSDKDAMKNSDYGAMWMLGRLTGDSKLLQERLPQAANFKRMQQERTEGFFFGAAAGQYYLHKSKRFAEEWGPYTEPIGTTYYMMMDIGNMFLFEPHRMELKQELRHAADWLLSHMQEDGQWVVAYDNQSNKPLFEDLEDLRPTFYGMFVAYKLLKDQKYKDAAIKGADWYIKNAVNKGWFLGVCGDTRFAPDFATIQAVQALLDIYTLTDEDRYRIAAHRLARYYITSIYTHPIPSILDKSVNGISRKDWEISQVGLNFEHGGIIGSANHHGPILLASHAGLFVRLYGETRDSIFLDMARAAVWGRDAFVDNATGVASYYWDAMNKGAGPFPHHAWWQIGWIIDYLVSEATLRTEGQIVFPRGFITPKVGPHQSYGFALGHIFGHDVELLLRKEMISIDNPNIEYITAIDTQQKQLYVILLNNSMREQNVNMQLELIPDTLWGEHPSLKKISVLDADGHVQRNVDTSALPELVIPAVGLNVVKIDLR